MRTRVLDSRSLGYARAMASRSKDLHTLAIDVGGSGLKAMILDARGKPLTQRLRVDTPRPATPTAVLAALREIIAQKPRFDRVSVGFPGVVVDGVTHTAPNLHPSWQGFDLRAALQKHTKKPTRVLNDAGVQGFGVVEGKGTEMVLTFGTGMGCALFVDHHYVPNLELAHHPFKKGKTYEEYVGNAAFEDVGKKKWNKRVREVLAQVQPIFNPRLVHLGGGNSKHLSGELPDNVRVVANTAGITGGIALWKV
jgi:polyphosphate glucokinase